MAASKENYSLVIILTILIIAYMYLLLSPTQPRVPLHPKHFVIPEDTASTFAAFWKAYEEFKGPSSLSSGWGDVSNNAYGYGANGGFFKGNYSDLWGKDKMDDDFFLEGYKDNFNMEEQQSEVVEPIVPSSKFVCEHGWIAIRSELNYKYLWMHAGENMWMGATGTIDTPLHRKAFEITPVGNNCTAGWVRLRPGDSEGYIMMVAPSGTFAMDEWVVKIGSKDVAEVESNPAYHFLIEEEGYLLNRGAMAFVNVMPEAEYSVRGHTSGWDRTRPAGREYGSIMDFTIIPEDKVQHAIEQEEKEEKVAIKQNEEYIAMIKTFPKPANEKWVISFGLYGAKDKYTQGAIKNAELVGTYFPGWVLRYYVTEDVPVNIVSKLRELGAEIESIPSGMGYSSGMFWRFIVADDPTVDRYIVRDVDSRLNARDRIAVEEWIKSQYPVHIERDHVNHCIVMNGGMWGGTKGAVPNMKDKVLAWASRDEYMADLHFLEQQVWPDIQEKQLSHDSYCCDRFPGTKPFPTKRPYTYQHVGQVFDANDNPRMMDIDGFIRGVPIPASCRKDPEWIYG
jgi:hypothetical protein